MKKLLIFALLTGNLWAVKNPHPRLLGLVGKPLGALDGSTVGSLRWEAKNNTVAWQNFCTVTESNYSRTPAFIYSGSLWQPMVHLGLAYQIMNGITFTPAVCTHLASQYAAQGIAFGDYFVNQDNTSTVPGAVSCLHFVGSLTLSSGGTGYPASGNLTFTGTSSPIAKGTFTSVGGVINSVLLTAGGGTYTSAPTVSAPTGTGAVITANMGCNTTTSPPRHGNDMRNIVGFMAIAFDYLHDAMSAPSISAWVTWAHQCASNFILPSGYGQYGYNQSATAGAGPGANGYQGMWMGTVLVGEATSGDNPTDTSSGCVNQVVNGIVIQESSCNQETTAYLQNFINNTLPWWTLQGNQQQVYPNLNRCTNVALGSAYTINNYLTTNGGGNGCGSGGIGDDGTEYAPQTTWLLDYSVDMVSGADTTTNLWQALGTQFATDQGNALIYNLSPFTDTLGWGVTFPAQYEDMNYEDQQGGQEFRMTATGHMTANIVAAELQAISSTTLASNLRYYANTILPFPSDPSGLTTSNNGLYVQFDLQYKDNTGLAVTNWLGTAPLDYWAPGNLWLLFRKDTTANSFWGVSMAKAQTSNHEHPTLGGLQLAYKGQWVMLSPPHYGTPFVNLSINSILTYQGPNDAAMGANFWRGMPSGNRGKDMPGFRAGEIDSQGRYAHTWFEMQDAYQAPYTGQSGIYTVHSTNPVFTSGTWPVKFRTFVGLGPTGVGVENVYTITVASGTTFNWSCSGPCTGGAGASGVTASTVSNPLGTGSQAAILWNAASGLHAGDTATFYADNWGNWLNPQLIQREAVYIQNAPQPYIVVFDRHQWTGALTNVRQQWILPYSTTAPSVSGNTIISSNNGEGVYITPVYPVANWTPAVQSLATIPEVYNNARLLLAAGDYTATSWSPVKGVNFYQGYIQTSGGGAGCLSFGTCWQTSTLIQTGDSGLTATPPESITATGLNCTHIKDVTQDQNVCFSSDPSGGLIDLTTPKSFSLTRVSASAQHLVFDLPSQTTVKVQVANVGLGSTVTISNSAGAGTALVTSNQGGLVIPDPLTGGALIINNSSPPANGVVNVSYSYTFTATGGTPGYTWSKTAGTLPTGLSLGAGGVLNGTPSVAGTYTFTIQVQDSLGATSAAPFSMTVAAQVNVSSGAAPGGTTAVPYTFQLTATGGNLPIVWSITVGSLPTGLSLGSPNCLNGQICGIPTGSGTSNFTVQACDSTTNTGPSCATQANSININGVGPALTVTTASPLPTGVSGNAYGPVVMSASGGSGTGYTWALIGGAFPTGLSMDAGGNITGTPTQVGGFSPDIQVTDSLSATAHKVFSLTINGAIVVLPTNVPAGTVGVTYPTTTFTATGGTPPYTFTVSSGVIPGGMSLSSSGVFSGVPTTVGEYIFTVLATDNIGSTGSVPIDMLIGQGGSSANKASFVKATSQ